MILSALNDRVSQASIIHRLEVQLMDHEVSCYQPTRALKSGIMAKLEDLMIMGNLNAVVSHPWFLFNFQVHALKRLEARDAGTTERRMLTAAVVKRLALQHNG